MNENIDGIGDELRQFVERFEVNEPISENNAQIASNEFLKNQKKWVEILGYNVDCIDKHGNFITGSMYGHALVIYTASLRLSKDRLNEKILNDCDAYIKYFENDDSVKFHFDEKSCMRFNIGFCWNYLGREKESLENLRSAVYNRLRLSQHYRTAYEIDCYQYKPCSKYVFQSLLNNTLNVSSPSVFNDVFDTPILNYLSQGEEEDKLLKKVYEQCVKVACFTRNVFLPSLYDKQNVPEYKPKGNIGYKEYENILMWAHYADSHKGICIKYRFPTEMSMLEGPVLTCFGDVIYTDDMSSIYKKKSINENDAFFAKAKDWEYENELRYLYFNKADCGSEHNTVQMNENYIEAVYFGVKCSDSDKKAIINLLKGRKYKITTKNIRTGTTTREYQIRFYQMNLSKNKYGNLYAERLYKFPE